MGAWGGGLYDGDYALDLKGTLKAVLRAPLSDDEVLAELWASLGKGAVELDALDYWLVLADQLERRGIRRQDIFERAIAIVEAGEDVAMLKELEAEPKTIAKRRKETTKLAGAAARSAAGEAAPAGEDAAAAPARARRGADLADRSAATRSTRMFPRISSGSSAASRRTAGASGSSPRPATTTRCSPTTRCRC